MQVEEKIMNESIPMIKEHVIIPLIKTTSASILFNLEFKRQYTYTDILYLRVDH